jgi:hypothetical protein
MQYKPVNITCKFGFKIFINNFFFAFLLKNYQLGGFTDRTLYILNWCHNAGSVLADCLLYVMRDAP